MFKKRYFMFLVLLLLVTGCSSNHDITPDSIPFTLLSHQVLSADETVAIYEVENPAHVYYAYLPLQKPDSSEWHINYLYTYDYLTESDKLPNPLLDILFEVVKPNLGRFSQTFHLELQSQPDGFQEEREIHLEQIPPAAEILLIDLYIPYKVVYQRNNSTRVGVVMLPVCTFSALKQGDGLTFHQFTLSYETFIQKENVFQKDLK